MKAFKKDTIGNLVAAAILAFSLTDSASAGSTASGTVRLGVVLVPTVQAEPQPAAQTLQFAMGNGATLRIHSANPSMNGQVREIELAIGPETSKTGEAGSSPASPTSQATAKLIQTTFVAD
jgi:hypothetical protein